jgi:hypothetical protein
MGLIDLVPVNTDSTGTPQVEQLIAYQIEKKFKKLVFCEFLRVLLDTFPTV